MREMKTVHLSDIYTQFIKIDLYQPYDNEQNIFHQVSLISVSCIGQQLEAFQDSVLQDKYSKAFDKDINDDARDMDANLSTIEDQTNAPVEPSPVAQA